MATSLDGVYTYDGASWSGPVKIDPVAHLTHIACPSTSFCLAMDQGGNAITFDGKSWSAPARINPTVSFYFSSLSCASASFCVAVDSGGTTGTADIFNGSTWGTPQSIGMTSPEALSCTSSTFCMVINLSGQALTYDGISWSDVSPTGASGGLGPVACVSATFCIAETSTTRGPGSIIYDGHSWTAPAPMTAGMTAGGLLACASTTFCVAVSNTASSFDGKAWGATTGLSGGLTSVSCPTASVCVAVDRTGRWLRFANGIWSVPASIDPGFANLLSVSCPTVSFCMTVDDAGNALRYHGTSWSAPISIDPGQALGAVSCASAQFCAAIDTGGSSGGGRILYFNGSSWSAPTQIAPGEWLKAISCPSASFCAALDLYGEVVDYDGMSWTKTGVQDLQLEAVSCPSTKFCVATVPDIVSLSGNVTPGKFTVYDGTSWSPVQTGGAPSVVSCAPAFCAGTDVYGAALTFQNGTWTRWPGEDPFSNSLIGDVESVSCPTSQFCMSVEENAGAAITWTGSSATAPRPPARRPPQSPHPHRHRARHHHRHHGRRATRFKRT